MKSTFYVILCLAGLHSCQPNPTSMEEKGNTLAWESYLGGADRNHYTTLAEITPDNVEELRVAWRYYAPDSGQMQMNPVIQNGKLFGVDARVSPFALDAATGEEIWRFEDTTQTWHSTHRGITYWTGEDGAERVLVALGPYLYALDAQTGRPVDAFGKNGRIDLHNGLPAVARNKFIASTTPGTLYRNLIIMPVRVGEGADAAPGDIRAFDVRTGEIQWTFHTLPYPGEAGYEAWDNKEAYLNNGIGGANSWAGMALDQARGIVYVPTGSVSPDFFGGDRPGDNRYANSLLALSAETGKLLWYFQFTHHDIWDRDLPAPPNLITVKRDGKPIPAVAQITKQGDIFLFDRVTGVPLFEVEEQPVPVSELSGEVSWPTQPRPVKPRPFARQAYELTENDISPYAPDRDSLLRFFKTTDRRWYAPGNTSPVLLLPGYDGGAEWGGAGADPENGILYINSNEMAWIHQLKDLASEDRPLISSGAKLYQMYCAACHLNSLEGIPESGYPELKDVSRGFTLNAFRELLTAGKGMMPGYPQLKDKEITDLYAFIGGQSGGDKKEVIREDPAPGTGQRYRHMGYRKFLDANGLPAISPPWGTLSAVDMNTGEYLWRIPFGEEDRVDMAVAQPTGTENYGGPVITANGLLIIAASRDGYFRIFNRHNGTLLWKYKLPAPAFATPATYVVNGCQYIVVACGGEKLGTPSGNQILAFALPDVAKSQ
ncbi:outer membrane protein assembly factor BamB family protein [Robertkochia flava]|uniref:outer membrane protein assembly factor BamB family protein n=1 Tax=Robertkochia flava TaxID=3447986 RepID=UPI001CCCB71B|nr:PQQ-binding-like beta-propeller repeat protein [Robertkochia marina]